MRYAGLSALAHADPDVDFANELHTYEIYGPKDYNAWISKITYQRLDTGLDHEPAFRRSSSSVSCQRTAAPSRRGSSSARRCAATARTNRPSSNRQPLNSKEPGMLIKVDAALVAVSVAAMRLPAVASPRTAPTSA